MKVLDRMTKKRDDSVVVFESIEKVYTKEDLLFEINNIQRQKNQIIQQNKRQLEEYNRLTEQEGLMAEMLNMFANEEFETLE